MNTITVCVLFFVTGGLCACLGGAVVNSIWRKKFAKCVLEENTKRDATIRKLNVEVERHKTEAKTWHERALVALRAAAK